VLPAVETGWMQTVLKGVPTTQAGAVAQVKSFESSDTPYRALARIFHDLFPIALVLAAAGTLLGVLSRTSRYRGLWLLCLILAVGVFFRLMVLGIETTTEAPTVEARYGLVVQDLLIAFAVLGTVLLYLVLRDEMARRYAKPGSRGVPETEEAGPSDDADRTDEFPPVGVPDVAEGAMSRVPSGAVLDSGGRSAGGATRLRRRDRRVVAHCWWSLVETGRPYLPYPNGADVVLPGGVIRLPAIPVN
jgi:hypothetical protein